MISIRFAQILNLSEEAELTPTDKVDEHLKISCVNSLQTKFIRQSIRAIMKNCPQSLIVAVATGSRQVLLYK